MMRATKHRRGFSLLELSIVITIVGLMAFAGFAVATAQIEAAKITQTKEKMERIENALAVYFNTNKYLPCPANSLAALSSATFGLESRSGSAVNTSSSTGTSCNASNIIATAASNPKFYIGGIPSRTLGLSDDYAFDAWGNRINYAVSRYCVAALNWGDINTYGCAQGDTSLTNGSTITIKYDTSISFPQLAAYAIISHGKNGNGAVNRGGSRTSSVTAANFSAFELVNGGYNTGTGATVSTTGAYDYLYDRPITDGSITAKFFDDIVRYKSGAQFYYDATH